MFLALGHGICPTVPGTMLWVQILADGVFRPYVKLATSSCDVREMFRPSPTSAYRHDDRSEHLIEPST